jgi:hypothetical protein
VDIGTVPFKVSNNATRITQHKFRSWDFKYFDPANLDNTNLDHYERNHSNIPHDSINISSGSGTGLLSANSTTSLPVLANSMEHNGFITHQNISVITPYHDKINFLQLAEFPRLNYEVNSIKKCIDSMCEILGIDITRLYNEIFANRRDLIILPSRKSFSNANHRFYNVRIKSTTLGGWYSQSRLPSIINFKVLKLVYAKFIALHAIKQLIALKSYHQMLERPLPDAWQNHDIESHAKNFSAFISNHFWLGRTNAESFAGVFRCTVGEFEGWNKGEGHFSARFKQLYSDVIANRLSASDAENVKSYLPILKKTENFFKDEEAAVVKLRVVVKQTG